MDTQANAAFKIGDKVTAVAFTDCFGTMVPERRGMTITKVTLVECSHIPSYYRFVAHPAEGFGYIEAAERFFEAE